MYSYEERSARSTTRPCKEFRPSEHGAVLLGPQIPLEDAGHGAAQTPPERRPSCIARPRALPSCPLTQRGRTRIWLRERQRASRSICLAKLSCAREFQSAPAVTADATLRIANGSWIPTPNASWPLQNRTDVYRALSLDRRSRRLSLGPEIPLEDARHGAARRADAPGYDGLVVEIED
jgi:hypothetical protein